MPDYVVINHLDESPKGDLAIRKAFIRMCSPAPVVENFTVVRLGTIRKKLFKKLEGKKFDVAFVALTGGGLLIGDELKKVAKKIVLLNTQMRFKQDKNYPVIKKELEGSDKKVLLLELDAGERGLTLPRLRMLSELMTEHVPRENITVACGIVDREAKKKYDGVLDVHGMLCNGVARAAEEFDMEGRLRTNLNYLHSQRRKYYKIAKMQKKRSMRTGTLPI